MPVSIIHILEMIEVDEDQRELECIAMRAVNFGVEHEIQVAGVVQRGAVVCDRQLVNPLHMPRVFDGDGRIVCERFQKYQVTFAESLRTHTIDQFDDAYAMSTGA